jgi:hypothetical protein
MLKLAPVSVMDKSRIPPSGDKHDYLSQAPYCWPDPAKPWPKDDIAAVSRADLLPLLAEGFRRGGDPPWHTLLAKFGTTPEQLPARWHLLLDE